MIALAEQADEEYGRRLREGLEEARLNRKEPLAKAEFGEEMHPLGAKDADKAIQEAIEKGKDADPY